MKFKNLKIEKIYNYMASVSRKAYSDPYLIANDVLCKQDTRGRILETCLSGETPKRVTFFFVVKKIIFYFFKNLAAYLLYLFSALAHWLSRQSYRLPENGELLILDIYIVVRKIHDSGKFTDSFFPGLADALERRRKKYAYTPRFFGSMQPLELYRVFRVLRKNGDSVLTEFQLLNLADYLEIIRFIFFYPISVLRFEKKLGNTYEDEVLRRGLYEALDSVAIGGYIRFLFGRRLSFIKVNKIKCLSWYENQVLDKNFYRGLRSTHREVNIIGAQFFIRPHTLLNIFPDEGEACFGVVPDKILVNGPGYLFELGSIPVSIGPALRYTYLFDEKKYQAGGNIILIVMPISPSVIQHIINVIREVDWWPVPVEIKFHPSMDARKYQSKELDRYCVTNKALPDLLSKALVVVGHSSGSLVEATALGIPAIDIQNRLEFSHDYMPELGKGILWDQATKANDITRLVNKFKKTLELDPSYLKKEGGRIKSNIFSEPTDELIGKAFELD
jgi:hypothetical protein